MRPAGAGTDGDEYRAVGDGGGAGGGETATGTGAATATGWGVIGLGGAGFFEGWFSRTTSPRACISSEPMKRSPVLPPSVFGSS